MTCFPGLRETTIHTQSEMHQNPELCCLLLVCGPKSRSRCKKQDGVEQGRVGGVGNELISHALSLGRALREEESGLELVACLFSVALAQKRREGLCASVSPLWHC